MSPHPSHPGWFRPPIPHAPTICEACGADDRDEAAGEPCPGPRDPTDDDIARMYDAPSAAETHAAAWRQSQEAHR